MDSHRRQAAALAAALAALSLALGAAGAALAAPTRRRTCKARWCSVDVYDRATARRCRSTQKDGRHYIVGTPGHEYAVRIRNCTGARILAVTSVDGVNVISGDTAAPRNRATCSSRGAPSRSPAGARASTRTAAFYFTDLGDSYAARTGRPQNVGVIGVAVFQEKAAAASRSATTTIAGAATRAERERRGCARAECAAERRGSARHAAPAPRRDARPRAAASAARAGFARDAQKSHGQARHRPRPQRGVARDA